MHRYKPQGVCAKEIQFEVEDGIVKNVIFERGCKGNLEGIARLVTGMPVKEVITRLAGIRCQGETSCPDQLARALRELK